MKQTFSVTVAS